MGAKKPQTTVEKTDNDLEHKNCSMPPLQQTKPWQSLQESLGKTVFFEETDDFVFLATLERTKLGDYLYVPYGPYLKVSQNSENTTQSAKTAKSPRPALKNAAKHAYEALKALGKQKSVTFIRIEPQQSEIADFWANLPNSHKSKDLNPAETWCLDLTQSKEDILHGMSQGTRTRHNTFAKKGLEVTISKNPDDIRHLVRLQSALAKERGIGTFSEKYLKTELSQPFASLFLVKYVGEESEDSPKKDEILAASLFFDQPFTNVSDENQSLPDAPGGTRYYMQSAASLKYKKLPATVALLSTAIFDAKEKGFTTFDFWGIAPDGAPKTHPWYGFTKFKQSFGGYEKKYCGTFDIALNPRRYTLYRLARNANRHLRKLVRK